MYPCFRADTNARLLAEVKGAARTPVGLSSLLDVSPNKHAAVKRACARGVTRSTSTDVDDVPKRKKRRFLYNVAAAFTPIVKQICRMPKFSNNESDEIGVAEQVLERIIKEKKQGNKRRRLFTDSLSSDVPTGMTDRVKVILDPVLQELSSSWQQAMRAHDRNTARSILQMTLSTIPAGSGKVLACTG